ncbi:hypothetical protein BOX15_Mlig030040g1 [Macrostomum lignano]|uniref:Sodium-dependent transporter n=1 Tax=Macrostomum lignano TaxID=282301 RepID=A0A267ELP9_9PLAT|nr:hypothetical protein BOX15_Mlig030040g1 [Macrostomum lignano]
MSEEKKEFSSTLGIVFSCMGTVVGTGNVWRFPRIAAQNSASQGTLIFLITWMLFLFIWSSPMLLIEYVIGRYYKKTPIQSFQRAMGDKFIWCGGWVSSVTFFISCYYAVILGWCLYYLYEMIRLCIVSELPQTEEESALIFDNLTNSAWPALFHGLAIFLAGACVIGGITWIEKVNLVLVPTLLVIIVVTYTWSVLQPFGDYGIRFLFTPDVESLSNAKLWVDALTQNAFDTGAAMGLIVPYATYMSAKNGVVKFATMIPLMNNLVSLICAITIFGTVFSTLVNSNPSLSRTGIVEIIKTTGPASTGLTFVWIPILFGSLGVVGKLLCIMFFLCLCFAGLSTVIADVEHTSQTLCNFGLSRRLATPVCGLLMFSIGLPSALSIQVLDNQDFIWGFALLPSGLMFQALVFKVGWNTFKEDMVNKYGIGDWPLTNVTMVIILIVAPIEAIALLIWWIYDEISATADNDPGSRWYDFGLETLMTCFVTWIALIILLVICNVIAYHIRPSWMRQSNRVGDVSSTVDAEAGDIGMKSMSLDEKRTPGDEASPIEATEEGSNVDNSGSDPETRDQEDNGSVTKRSDGQNFVIGGGQSNSGFIGEESVAQS